MKTLEIRRHGQNSGDTLTQAGIDQLASLKLAVDPSTITDVFNGSAFGRTKESLDVVIAAQGIAPVRVHPAHEGLGNAAMFQRFVDGVI